jgi:hypothetical protein
MPLVRRRLSWIIRIWLLCQAAGLAAAPLGLCCGHPSAAEQTPSCCRGLAPGKTCPMHHGDDDDRTCKMRSACSGSDAALLTLAGGVGVLPTATSSVTAFVPGDVVTAVGASALLRADRPESPPPRA